MMAVSRGADAAVVERARAIAQACGLEYHRKADRRAPACIVLECGAAHMVVAGRTVKSHPGLGLVRLRRLRRGEEDDPLPKACDLRPGDTVLDATFGYGTDSLVLAWGVGAAGKVLALEASPVLAALAMAGMAWWPHPAEEVSGRIELRHADYEQVLSQMAPGSVDVVYFDPMFSDPRDAAPDFDVLRTLADARPLTPEALALARRAARRRVVVKDSSSGRGLRRLGIEPLPARRSAEILYGAVAATGV
jgi:hypothetical protein